MRRLTHAAIGLCFGMALLSCADILGLDEFKPAPANPTGGSGGAGGSGGGQPCTPMATEACYEGPAGTENKGICKGGTRTCNAGGTAFGPCEGQVLPTPENCATPDDDDCNGTAAQCTGTHLWSKRFGNMNADQDALSIAADSQGNVIMSGSMQGTVDFGGGGLTTAGSGDAFLAKFGPNGEHRFSKRFGDGNWEYGDAVAVDGGDNVILAGTFLGTIDLGGGVLQSTGSEDIFLAKFDSQGSHIFSKAFGVQFQQFVTDVASDASGNIVLAGSSNGIVDFGGGMLSAGTFLAIFDSAGTHVFSRQLSANMAHIALDGSGNVSFAGDFTGTLDLGSGMQLMAQTKSLFIAKLDPTGKPILAKNLGTTTSSTINPIVAVDGTGNIFIAGAFTGSIDLDGTPLMSSGLEDIFVAKLDAMGNHLWSRSYGDAMGSQGVTAIAVDQVGHAVLTGTFTGKLDFGLGSLSVAAEMLPNIFAAKLDGTGNPLWSKGFGGDAPPVGSPGGNVAVDRSGNVALSGSFVGWVGFGGPTTLQTMGKRDIYTAKLTP